MTTKKPGRLQEKFNRYLSIAVLALFVIVPPILCGLFYLSQVPDITWGDENSPSFTRIWMHRERRPVGIGYQSQRVVAEYSTTKVCVETRLRFLLWGESNRAEPNTTSREMVLQNNRWQPSGQKCR